MGIAFFQLYIFESEGSKLEKHADLEGSAKDLKQRFFSLPDVEFEAIPDCPSCVGKPDCGDRYNCGQDDASRRCFTKVKDKGFRWAVFGDVDEYFALHPMTATFYDSHPE